MRPLQPTACGMQPSSAESPAESVPYTAQQSCPWYRLIYMSLNMPFLVASFQYARDASLSHQGPVASLHFASPSRSINLVPYVSTFSINMTLSNRYHAFWATSLLAFASVRYIARKPTESTQAGLGLVYRCRWRLHSRRMLVCGTQCARRP